MWRSRLEIVQPLDLRDESQTRPISSVMRRKKTLAAKLARLEAHTQHQMVIAIMPSFGGKGVEPLRHRPLQCKDIGREDINDRIVILVVPK